MNKKKLKVIQLYKKQSLIHRLFWSDRNLHHGIYEKKTDSFRKALDNTNKLACSLLSLDKKDKVLDIGCGFGGTCRYMAKRYGAKVTGINLSPSHHKIAEKNIKKLSTVKLLKKDMDDMQFKPRSFNKVIAIESMCYTKDKSRLLKNIFKILEKKGKIVVIDRFINKLGNKQDKELYSNFLTKGSDDNLTQIKIFKKYMKDSGFRDIKTYDITKKIKRTIKRLNRLGKIANPLFLILFKIGIVSKTEYEHIYSCLIEKKLFEKDILRYVAITAKK